MFPGPNDIPARVDCVPALASTGVDGTLALIVGLIVLALGITFFVVARGRLRGSGVALGLVLLLGTAGLAVAPVSSAQADDCTPIDYQLDAELESAPIIDSGDTAIIEFTIVNVADHDGTPPIVVSIPKLVNYGIPTLAQGDQWTFDNTNPDAYLFTYAGPLPKGTMSSTAAFTFTVTNGNNSPAVFDVPVSIVTGSGGDTVTTNNTDVVSFTVNGTVG